MRQRVTRAGAAGRMLLALALALLLGGCDLRPLLGEELFGGRDGGADEDAGDARDGSADADAEADADADGDGDADPGKDVEGGTGACTLDSCAADQFCDEITGRCASRLGTAWLTGVVWDACRRQGARVALNARVWIAGHRQCSNRDKGSFNFLGLPFGTFRIAVYKAGWKALPPETTVTIAPGGTVHDIELEPDTPGGCADPAPAEIACTCVDPGCTP